MVTLQIRLNEDTIQDVVQAADLLLLTDLKTLCCEFLEGCIAAENCIGIRDFALHYCLHHVHYLATEYLETHFRDVSSTEEFLELSPQKLKEVISLEKLNVGNERYVFEAVIRWIAHDVEMRKVPSLRTWPWVSTFPQDVALGLLLISVCVYFMGWVEMWCIAKAVSLRLLAGFLLVYRGGKEEHSQCWQSQVLSVQGLGPE